MNLWKDLKTGPSIPKVLYAVIETPKGSECRYKYDKDNEMFVLDKVLCSTPPYPVDCGIIPQTVTDNGYPMDIMVIMTQPTFPGCIIECKPVGMVKIKSGKIREDKVIGVPVKNSQFEDIQNIHDLPLEFLEELAEFLRKCKNLEGKTVDLLKWESAERVLGAVKHSMELYTEMLAIKSLFLLNK